MYGAGVTGTFSVEPFPEFPPGGGRLLLFRWLRRGSRRCVLGRRRSGARRLTEMQPLTGTPREMAAVLRQYADLGVGHVQLVMDPITTEAIEEFAPVLEELDRA